MDESAPMMVQRLVGFMAWLESDGCMIRDEHGKTIPLRPNKVQRKIWDEMVKQAWQERPIRLIVLKARQLGVTTFDEALQYFMVRSRANWESLLLAHTEPETGKIFKIAKRFWEHDTDFTEGKPPKSNEVIFRHPGGTAHFAIRTGGGHFVGSGGTLSALIITELAKWQGTANAVEDQMASLLGSVAEIPDTFVVIESTANKSDVSGEFRRRWELASSGNSDYAPVFCGWMDRDDYVRNEPLTLPLDADEQWLVESLGASDAQLAWRRHTIRNRYNGRVDLFRQEFPSTPEEAWQAHRGTIFPGLKKLIHHWSPPLESLVAAGWEFYRGIDWGDADPFCTLWIAHKPGPPRYSADTDACPEHWRELVGWQRDDRGRPLDRENHSIDALRYAVVTYRLTGHVHVFDELYVRNSAHKGQSIGDLVVLVRERHRELEYSGSAADRSRPGSINFFNQNDVWVQPYSTPTALQEGMIEDGITHLNGLIIATSPLEQPEPASPWEELALKTNRTRSFPASDDLDATIALRAYEERRSGGFTHPFYEESYCGR